MRLPALGAFLGFTNDKVVALGTGDSAFDEQQVLGFAHLNNLQVVQVRDADNLLLIKGAIPGSNGDYVVIRESKKRPKGWKPHAERPENVKKAEAKKK